MELARNPFLTLQVDSSWTLFLDRDGVINVNKDESYVCRRDEFIFKEGALEAIYRLSSIFGKIIVVTNQRGVSKGLMTEDDLLDIHSFMLEKIEKVGGRIDHIFYCTALEDQHPDRKPNTGMALKAKEKYPEIDFSRSIMVGDKSIDMKWGKNIGAMTVWITSPYFWDSIDATEIDLSCDSLFDLAHLLQVKL